MIKYSIYDEIPNKIRFPVDDKIYSIYTKMPNRWLIAQYINEITNKMRSSTDNKMHYKW